MAKPRQEHQTTIRFTEEMWRSLEKAAAAREVSVAQYVRDAARARLIEEHESVPVEAHGAAWLRAAEQVREKALDQAESYAALWEQGRAARERARMLRDEAREKRRAGP
jgi:predicted DNA-binding ribbon-helix-helix protein